MFYCFCVEKQKEENVTDDIRAIVNSELIEKFQSKRELDVSISKMNCSVENNQPQDIKDNTVDGAQAINIQYEKSEFERSLLEYERIIPIQDVSHSVSGNCVELLITVARKTAYILHWLDGINKVTNTEINKPSILELLRENHDYDETVDTSKEIQLRGASQKSSNSNKFRMRNRHDSGYRNEVNNINNIIFYLWYIHETLI